MMDKFGLTRRQVLKTTLGASVVALAPKMSWAQSTTPVTFAMNWIGNVSFAGFFTALDKGYYAEEGIDYRYLIGGPGAPDPLVTLAAGQAEIAQSNWLPVLDAIALGNDLVVLGANFPVPQNSLISLPSRPVLTAEDLVGARLLLQAPVDGLIMDAILTMAGLPVDYEAIPTGFSPEPLLAGDGDAFYSNATNQPVTLELQGMVPGEDFHVALLADMGYNMPGALFVTTRAYLESNRPEIVGFLKATVRGWQDNVADPEAGARLVVEQYSQDLGLDLAHQIRTNELQLPFFTAPDSPGMLWFDPAVVGTAVYEVARATDRTDLPDPESIVDMGPLEEALADL